MLQPHSPVRFYIDAGEPPALPAQLRLCGTRAIRYLEFLLREGTEPLDWVTIKSVCVDKLPLY